MPSFALPPLRRSSPRRPAALTLLATSCALSLTAVAPAYAQQAQPQTQQRSGEVMGLRYLSWSGKAAGPNPASDGLRRPAGGPAGGVEPQSVSAPINASGDTRYPGIQSMARPSRYGPGTGSASSTNGLTPASAWSARPATGGMPQPASSTMTATAPSSPPVGVAPVYSAQPVYAAQPVQPNVDPQVQAQIQSDYQAWYQQEAQRQYQSQVEAQMQASPALQQQPPIRVQAPSVQTTAQPDRDQPDRSQPDRNQPGQDQPAQYQQRADATPPPSMTSTTDASDPMAPRRDARIFQLQRPQADAPASDAATTQPAPADRAQAVPSTSQPTGGQAYAAAGPPREGARYYSVHRAEGRQPDPITMPESVYAPIDLAEPPAQPVQTRNVNGRLQAVVPNADPSLP
ncbi:hypothetical protein BH10PSE2_BH10PSE2_01940 [soil metagenome]